MHSFACEGESVMEAPILDRRPEFCKFTYHYLQGTVLGAHKNRSGRASFMSVAKKFSSTQKERYFCLLLMY